MAVDAGVDATLRGRVGNGVGVAIDDATFRPAFPGTPTTTTSNITAKQAIGNFCFTRFRIINGGNFFGRTRSNLNSI